MMFVCLCAGGGGLDFNRLRGILQPNRCIRSCTEIAQVTMVHFGHNEEALYTKYEFISNDN